MKTFASAALLAVLATSATATETTNGLQLNGLQLNIITVNSAAPSDASIVASLVKMASNKLSE